MHDDAVVSTLKEILKWTRIQAMPQAKHALKSALTKPEHRRLYQGLDGKRTQTQLSSLFGISQPRISQLVGTWLKAGIVHEVSPGKYLRSFDLEELGIGTAEDQG